MAHTVVGFFDNAAEAQDAIVKLTKYGIDRERIDISNNRSGDSPNRTSDGDSLRTSDSSYRTSDSDTLRKSDRDNYRSDENDRGVSYDRDNDRDNNRDHENGITRFFRNLFGDDDNDADKYSRVASRAASIVTVHANTSDEAEQAADILDDCGAVDVDERAAKYGTSGSNDSTSRNYVGNSGDSDITDRDYSDKNKTEKLDVIREDIEIGKREVERGGVRLRSRIVERPVEETVRLREEHVTVNRNPVDRAARDGDMANFQERDIEMIERAEVPVVKKESRVVEEVSLNKEVEEREETVRDTVRNTEVDIENIDRNRNSDRNLRSDTDLGTGNRNVSNDRRSNDSLSDDLTERGI